MSIDDFKGKRVTVMGIGLHGGGVGVINFLYQNGAKILATDLRTKKQLKESLDALKNFHGIEYVLGQHRENDFINTDLVIKNPAVPDDSKFLKIAKVHNVPIETDIGIFFELCPGPIIGVTGSRGKSTTSSLIYQILKAKHPDTILAGNIRMSVLEKLGSIQKTTLVVLELSSWQLNGLGPHKKSPKMAVITNIMNDHQNRYNSMEDYIDDKKVIFHHQKDKDFLVLNYDDPIVKKFASDAKSKIYYYSLDAAAVAELEKMPQSEQEPRIGAHIAADQIFFGAGKEKIAKQADVKLIGRHNLSNALAAVTVAKLFNVPARTIKQTLQEFGGLQGRIELVKEISGVKYINDTTATIPEATMAAIEALSCHLPLDTCRLIVIAGGADKKLNFQDLARLLCEKAAAVMLLNGSATPKLEFEIKKQAALMKKKLPIKRFKNMSSAVSHASGLAKSGDIVLLSPGCASFGMFRHEFERGDRFNEAVASLNR